MRDFARVLIAIRVVSRVGYLMLHVLRDLHGLAKIQTSNIAIEWSTTDLVLQLLRELRVFCVRDALALLVLHDDLTMELFGVEE